MSRPRRRFCLDCGVTVTVWDLDAPATCEDCVAERRGLEGALAHAQGDVGGAGGRWMAGQRPIACGADLE